MSPSVTLFSDIGLPLREGTEVLVRGVVTYVDRDGHARIDVGDGSITTVGGAEIECSALQFESYVDNARAFSALDKFSDAGIDPESLRDIARYACYDKFANTYTSSPEKHPAWLAANRIEADRLTITALQEELKTAKISLDNKEPSL